MSRPIVVIESPYAGDIVRNVAFARAAMEDSLKRGETPFASHLLYTQPGILDDGNAEERALGIDAGWAMMRVANLLAVYTNLGVSEGMQAGIRRAEQLGLRVEERRMDIESWDEHRCAFPFPLETDHVGGFRARLVRAIRIRWSMRTPVVVRDAMLELADEIERHETL